MDDSTAVEPVVQPAGAAASGPRRRAWLSWPSPQRRQARSRRARHARPVPPAVFDAHLHIVDPRFPPAPDQGYRPEPFTVEDYRRRTAALGIRGGAVVAASFQGFDQEHLLDALARLGPGFVG